MRHDDSVMKMRVKTIEWKGDRIRLLDQRRLPGELRYVDCRTPSAVAEAIRNMTVRGAPAIGVTAALGIALSAKRLVSCRPGVFRRSMERVCRQMQATRPTAVNLFWAVDRMRGVLNTNRSLDVETMKAGLEEEALRIYREDVEINREIGRCGRALIPEGAGILTHCNAGALATAGFGTALGVLRAAREQGKTFRVFADETRPMLQGARLTAWELVQEKIPVTVVTDNMAGWLMKQGKIDLVIVGAGRIARNGDTANKIGTYGVAVLARFHGIPFYVAAPLSTLDQSLSSGSDIPIEERRAEEVTHIGGRRMAAAGAGVYNPAFDVTPHALIEAIITEKGLIRKPFEKKLIRLKTDRRQPTTDH
jgi:methylthioribose-1-phosphate isomerase